MASHQYSCETWAHLLFCDIVLMSMLSEITFPREYLCLTLMHLPCMGKTVCCSGSELVILLTVLFISVHWSTAAYAEDMSLTYSACCHSWRQTQILSHCMPVHSLRVVCITVHLIKLQFSNFILTGKEKGQPNSQTNQLTENQP